MQQVVQYYSTSILNHAVEKAAEKSFNCTYSRQYKQVYRLLKGDAYFIIKTKKKNKQKKIIGISYKNIFYGPSSGKSLSFL